MLNLSSAAPTGAATANCPRSDGKALDVPPRPLGDDLGGILLPAAAPPIQPPLFATLPADWRDQLVKAGYKVINQDWYRTRRQATALEIIDRLSAYAVERWGRAAPVYDILLQCAQTAVDHCHPTEEGRDQNRREKGDRGHLTQHLRSVARADQIIAERAAGKSVKEVAAQLGVCTSLVTTRATPAAVAEYRQQIQTAVTPPLQDDSEIKPEFKESSEEYGFNSRLYLPEAWIIDTWTANVGAVPTKRQELQLLNWTGAGADDLIPDLVRMIVYARGKADPWAYVTASMASQGGEPECWPCLKHQATDKQRLYADYADNARAYLATSLRNARKKRQADAAPPDRGGYIDEVRRHYGGRLPWEDPPA